MFWNVAAEALPLFRRYMKVLMRDIHLTAKSPNAVSMYLGRDIRHVGRS